MPTYDPNYKPKPVTEWSKEAILKLLKDIQK